MLGRRAEIMVRAEQYQVVLATQVYEKGVDRAKLHTASAAAVAEVGRVDVVIAIRLQEPKRAESFDELVARLRAGKPLQEFLKYEARREQLIRLGKRARQCCDFRYAQIGVATKGERPDTRIYEQTHGVREREAL